MALNKKKLKELIEEKVILRGDFKLASGKKSDIYFDLRKATMDPVGIDLIGKIIYNMLEDDISAIGGLETGAIPEIKDITEIIQEAIQGTEET